MCTSWQGVIAQLTCANVDEEPAKLRDAPVDFDDVTELRVGSAPAAPPPFQGLPPPPPSPSRAAEVLESLLNFGGGEGGETYDQHMRKACVPANFSRPPEAAPEQLEWWNGDARVAEEIDASDDDGEGGDSPRAGRKPRSPATPPRAPGDDPFAPPAADEIASPLFAAALKAANAVREDAPGAAAAGDPPPAPAPAPWVSS